MRPQGKPHKILIEEDTIDRSRSGEVNLGNQSRSFSRNVFASPQEGEP